MAIVYAENVIEIAVHQTYAGRPSVNVWHMYLDSEWGSDTFEAVAQDFANNWQDHMLELCTGEQVLVGFEWRSLDQNDSSVGQVAPDAGKSMVGQLGGSAMPPNVAWLIHKNTAARPRGRRDGLCFLSGVPEADANSAGVIAGGTVAARNADLQDFYDGISDSSITAAGDRYPVVLETTPASRAPGTNPVTINSRRVTSITLDPLVSTQRDRLR